MIRYLQDKYFSNICASLGVLSYIFFVLGMWFHTSVDNAVFRKYNLKYFIVLCLLTLAIPFVFLVIRFFLSQQKLGTSFWENSPDVSI